MLVHSSDWGAPGSQLISLSTVHFEYERKMMNRSTALLIGPIFTEEYSNNVKRILSSACLVSCLISQPLGLGQSRGRKIMNYFFHSEYI